MIRFDNLSQAIARVLRGTKRVEQDRFVAFRSHYGFKASFTTPGITGAHEKGGVEGEVGRFRRRWLVPVPEIAGWDELNDYLRACCLRDLDRRLDGSFTLATYQHAVDEMRSAAAEALERRLGSRARGEIVDAGG